MTDFQLLVGIFGLVVALRPIWRKKTSEKPVKPKKIDSIVNVPVFDALLCVVSVFGQPFLIYS